MKVYVVIFTEVDQDAGINGVSLLGTYAKREDALAKFKQQRDEICKNYWDSVRKDYADGNPESFGDTSDEVSMWTDNETTFNAWVPGEYDINNTYLSVEEQEIL